MICFFSIVFSNIQRKYKFYALVIYIFLSIPYLILIFKWGGLVPIKTQVANPNAITNISRVGDLYFYHLGYLSTIVGFYLFPLILLKERNISKIITNFISSKWFYVIVVTPPVSCLREAQSRSLHRYPWRNRTRHPGPWRHYQDSHHDYLLSGS